MTTPSEPSLVQLWLHGGLDLSEQLQKEPPECPAENVSAHPTPHRDRTLVEQGVHRSLRLYNVLAGLLCVVLSALMLLTAADLPPYGSDTAPTVNEVAQRYVEQGTQETGAVNTVAGMILDYRAFDTLGESFVLFTAMCAVTILLNRSGKRRWLLQPDVVDYASDPPCCGPVGSRRWCCAPWAFTAWPRATPSIPVPTTCTPSSPPAPPGASCPPD